MDPQPANFINVNKSNHKINGKFYNDGIDDNTINTKTFEMFKNQEPIYKKFENEEKSNKLYALIDELKYKSTGNDANVKALRLTIFQSVPCL